MQWNWLYFGLGALGGLAPEIVRLYSLRTKNDEFEWSGNYVVVSLLLAVLAGVVAVILPSTNVWSAFYAGVATPSIITTAANHGKEKGETSDVVKKGGGFDTHPAPRPPSLVAFFAAL